MGRRAAEDAVAETGVDMTRFATGGHLVSWAGRAPLDKQSGKRKGQARHKKGNRYLGGILGETAISAGRTQTREGARYRKLARSRGKNKACVAVGNTQLKAYHKLLSNPGMRYEDLGPDYYERQAATRRKISRLVREIEAEGFEVTLCRPRARTRGRQPRRHSSRHLTHTAPHKPERGWPGPAAPARQPPADGCCRAPS